MTRDRQPIDGMQPMLRSGLRAAVVLVVASLPACSSDGDSASGPPPTFEGQPPSGFVDMREVQVAYIGSAGGGSGTLTSASVGDLWLETPTASPCI